MCSFTLNLADLADESGPQSYDLEAGLQDMAARYAPYGIVSGTTLNIAPEGYPSHGLICKLQTACDLFW